MTKRIVQISALTLLVAGLIALGVPVVAGTKILGAACAIGVLMVSERIAHRRFGGGGWYALCLMLVATEPWFVRWSASGMETPLAVLLLVIALEAGRRSADQVAWARDRGANVWGETCPQYLYLGLGQLKEPDFGGAKYVASPPVRSWKEVKILPKTLWRVIRFQPQST